MRRLAIEQLESRELLAWGDGVCPFLEYMQEPSEMRQVWRLIPEGAPAEVKQVATRIVEEARSLSGLGRTPFKSITTIATAYDAVDLMMQDWFDDARECGLEGPCGAFTEALADWVSQRINMHDDRYEITAWALAREKDDVVQNVIKFEYFDTDERDPDNSFALYVDNSYVLEDCVATSREVKDTGLLDNAFLTVTMKQIEEIAERRRKEWRMRELRGNNHVQELGSVGILDRDADRSDRPRRYGLALNYQTTSSARGIR